MIKDVIGFFVLIGLLAAIGAAYLIVTPDTLSNGQVVERGR